MSKPGGVRVRVLLEHLPHLGWKMRRMWKKALTLPTPKQRLTVTTMVSLLANTRKTGRGPKMILAAIERQGTMD